MGCNQRYNEAVASAYAGYSRFVAKHPFALFLVGLILAGLACVGLKDVETTNEVLDIWMYRGTRLDGERSYYEQYFGGDGRAENTIVSMTDGTNVATVLGLDSTLEATQWLVEGGTNAVTYELDDGSAVLGVKDVCIRPTVPVVYRPYTPDPDSTTFAWFNEGALMSYGYRFVTQCTKYDGGVAEVQGFAIPAPETDLPDGWGIDRFPCSRASPLDCFQEGNFDYPTSMQQIDEWSNYVFFNNMTAECVSTFGTRFASLLQNVGQPVEVATATGIAVADSLQQTVSAFWLWGYQWRKSYKSMTDAEILAHLEEALLFAKSDEADATTCAGTSGACCVSWAGTKLETDILFAGIESGTDGAGLKSIQHMMTTSTNYPINHPAWITQMETLLVSDEEGREEVARGWESAYLAHQEPRFNRDEGTPYASGGIYGDIDIDYFAERSGNDIIERGNSPEGALIWIAYVVMVVFAGLSMGSWGVNYPTSRLLYSRVLLTIGGVTIIALSTLAALGFVSAVGLSLTPLTVNVVPFLSLGIGIDDMLILVYSLVHSKDSQKTPTTRMELALAHSGPSVVLTSLANGGCFFVAAVVPIDTVQFFAIHMGVQMIFHVVALHLMFMPMMYWDSLRIFAYRADVIPVKLDSAKVVSESQFESRNGTAKFVRNFYAPLLKNKIFKALTVVIALVLTAVLTWYGLEENQLGVDLNTLAAEDSHEKSFLEIFEGEYTASSASLVTKDVDLATYQQTLLDAQVAVQEVSWVSDVSSVKDNSWLADSATSLLGPTAEPLPSNLFNSSFETWIQQQGITSAQNFYCEDGTDGSRVDCTEYNAATTVIKASLQTVFLKDQVSRENQADTVRDLRDALDGVDPSRETYAYGESFTLYSQYLYTWQNLGWVIGGGAACVLVVVTLLEGSLLLSLLICLSIVMAVLQVFGVLVLIDVRINGFSIVNLCVMIGMVVEFTAHIGRGFLFASGTKDERMEKALTELAWPTFAGACTTFLAVLPLTFSKITFFHNYYFQTFAVMTAFGFFTGVCFLPVLLSVVGPKSQHLRKYLDSSKAHDEVVILNNPLHKEVFSESSSGAASVI